MAVISGVVLVKSGWVAGGGGGGKVATGLHLEKEHPVAPLAAAICQTSNHTSHRPQQKMKLMRR